jgi:WD40 repeat protein
VGSLESAWRWCRRNAAVASLIATIVLSLLAGSIVSALFGFKSNRDANRALRAEQGAVQQRDRALAAEAGALAARGAEAAQRQKAEAAQRAEADLRQQALAALDRSESSLYLNRIALAERYWQASNQARADQILDACPPKLRDWEWRYLKRLGHSEVLTLGGDQAAYSPDGKLLATSAKDQGIQVRDAQTGKNMVNFRRDNPGDFDSLVFSPDSRRLAAICEDSTIRIWDLPAGHQTLKLPAPLKSRMRITPFYRLGGLSFSPDGKRIAYAAATPDLTHGLMMPEQVTVWDAITGKELLKVANVGLSVAFSPDGKHLATERRDRLLGVLSAGFCILDADTGHMATQIVNVDRDDAHLTYSSDGKWLISARGEKIKIWDATSGKEVRTLRGHTQPVTALAFSEDGKRLASSSMDETVRIWDPDLGETLFVYRGHTGVVDGVSFRPDGKFVACVGGDGTVRVWDATASQNARQIPGTQSFNGCVALSPDGRSIACLQAPIQPCLVVIDAATGRRQRLLKAFPLQPKIPAGALAFSADSRLLASALDHEVQVWDVATGAERARFTGVADLYQHSAAFSPDGARLAFTAENTSIEVWDIKEHNRLATCPGNGCQMMAIAFSPDGQTLASCGLPKGDFRQGEARIWDAATGRQIHHLLGHEALVSGVAFSRDGTRLVTTSWDQTARIWDVASGQELQVLRGHRSLVWSVAFNPSGTRLVTTQADGPAKLWAWPAGEEVLSLTVPNNAVTVAFVADGQQLSAASRTGVTVWDAAPRPASEILSQ